MNQRTLITQIALGVAALSFAAAAFSADKKVETVTLACDFPAAEVPQKVKPGHKNVSDGVIRVTEQKLTLSICQDCAWEKTGAKWQVTPTEYKIATDRGVAINISKKDGSALFAITTKSDEYYHGGHVESRGQCKPAAPEKS